MNNNNSKARGLKQKLIFGLFRSAAGVNLLALFAIISFLAYRGFPALTWEFISEEPRKMMTEGGIFPCLLGTLYLSFGSLCISFPLGVASAIYLHEYAGDKPFAKYIRIGVNNLSGVPSIVFGLFGLAFFVTYLDLGVSILSGILTLGIVTLPIIIGASEEALKNVPQSWRQASLALGAGKWQGIARVVLPAAFPSMLTGAILSIARAAGETAALMFTATVFYTPKQAGSIFDAVMSLPYHMYILATSGVDIEKTRPLQYATALVLILLVLGMNVVAIVIRDRMQSAKN